MEQRLLGRTGLRVSVIGFGGAEIGYESAEAAAVARMIDAAQDAGMNLIDTAECYGASEEMIGRALQGRRDQFILCTKCGHADGLPGGDWNPRMLARSLDRSLERLRTGTLDLLQLHSCSATVLKAGDVLGVLDDARAAGKTRLVGYSGDSDDALAAVESGFFDTLQTSINIADQEALGYTLPAAGRLGMGIIAKRPIANAAWKHQDLPPNEYHRPYWERLAKLRYPFLQEQPDEAVSTALRFTLAVPSVAAAIVGTKSEERWRRNLTIAGLPPMDKAEFMAIRRVWQNVAQPDWHGQV